MKKYDNYINSNIEWLGQIPAHWQIKKTKYICKFHTGWTPPTGKSELFYGDNKWLNISDISENKYIYDTENRISDEAIKQSNIQMSPKDSLLFSFKLSIGQVCFAGVDLYTNEAVATFAPSQTLNLHYAYYAFPICIVRNAKHNIYGAELLNQELISGATLCYPSLAEQQQISYYLDKQTAKIDELVQKQNKLIATLQEKKKSLINHAVTKGLNSDVKMKDSCIEWLGQIPAHWGGKKVKFIFSTNPDVLPENTPNDYEINYVDISSVNYDTGINNTQKMMFENAPSRARKIVNDGDVIISTVRTYLRAIARIAKPEPNLIVSTGFAVFTPIKTLMDSQFAAYLCVSEYCVNLIVSNSDGVSYPSINADKLNQIQLPLPPLEEQQQIVDYLDQLTTKIDELITKAKSMVALLGEHKQSLINHVVTGKIKVE